MTFQTILGAALGAWLMAASTPAAAQKTINLDGDKCSAGLHAFADLIDGSIHTTSSPQKLAGTCRAQNVRITDRNGDVALTIKKLRWGNGDLTTLADGQFPELLQLQLQGVRIDKAPKRDPVWLFLQQHSHGFRGLDADLVVTYLPDEKRLRIGNATLDFGGGNRVLVTGELENASSALLSRPEIYGLALTAKNLDISVTGTRRFGNDIVTSIISEIPRGQRPKGGFPGLRAELKRRVNEHLSPISDVASVGAMNRILDDLPHPSGTVSLSVQSEHGISVPQLLALSVRPDVAKVLTGAKLTFRHDTDLIARPN